MSLALVADAPLAPLPGTFKIDNLLTEQQRLPLYNFLRHAGWKYGWKSNSKEDTFAFWHCHFAGHLKARDKSAYDCADELKKNVAPLHAIWLELERRIFKGHTLIRCYANAHAYGIDGTLHTDSRKDNRYTAVYYPHETWEPNWGGETVLFNADKTDIIGAFYPKPNRLAVFKGNIPHLARGVSRTCPVLRITLMFKFQRGPLEKDIDDERTEGSHDLQKGE
jgi:SM-20-related protein